MQQIGVKDLATAPHDRPDTYRISAGMMNGATVVIIAVYL